MTNMNICTEKTTALAIAEGRVLAKDKSVKGYSDIDSLKAALDLETLDQENSKL